MKKQEPLTASEMREQFESARSSAREHLDKTGAGTVLQALSETVSTLQSNGVDIKLIVRANSHSNAYDMMYTVSGSGGGTIEAHGYLKIGETTHLFAVASRHNSQDVARLYLSKNNVVDEGGRISTDGGKNSSRTVIPGECYDFNEDAEALQKFQKRLIEVCAQNSLLPEYDTGAVFNKDAPAANLQKPVPKFKL